MRYLLTLRFNREIVMKLISRLRTALATLGAALILAACGGGSGSDPTASSPMPSASCTDPAGCGLVYVGLTDADGDFMSYTVDVVSLSLKRANGTVVETLPNKTRVDFAQYVDLTEFITAATVPNGSYVEGTLRLDYTNAEVTVEKNGQPVAATVVGANGSPLGVVDVRVILDNRNHLVVSPGRIALLTLDFNLSATNTVDLTATPVKVTARPALIASLEPVDEKEIRLRGPLVSVDTAASTYTIDVRPFHHRSARHGRLVVHTTSTTAFEVDGQSFTGAPGLQALATAGEGTATEAFGTLNVADHKFTAERVHAGTSVEGQGADTVIGTVISRAGDELTVRGATLVRNEDESNDDDDDMSREGDHDDDRADFERGDIKVMVGSATVVTKDGLGTQSQGAQALSVGQHIHANGTVSQTSTAKVLDATHGRVRMDITHLFGTVVTNNPGLMTLNLAAIDGRRISAFNFAGTGASTAMDADPANYEVKTPPVTIMQILAGRPMAVFGFVTPFGSAPPDFESRTLVSFGEVRSDLGIGWGDAGSAAPFSSMTSTSLILNLADPNIGQRHHIKIGSMSIDLKSLPASPMIVGATSGMTMFVIVTTNGIQHYSSFADFVAALTTSLDGSTRMVGFFASGAFDGTANTLTAKAAVAILK
jgi:hypothetical protein